MENRYIKVQYKLYAPMGKEKNIELVEETRPEMPFMFISGLGMVLKELENQLQDIKEGAEDTAVVFKSVTIKNHYLCEIQQFGR